MSYVPAEPPYGDFRPPREQVLQPTTTYEEWRVSGIWFDLPRERIFSPRPNGRRFNRGYADPEAAARDFIAVADPNQWTDGPHLHKRTVTITEWQEVEA